MACPAYCFIFFYFLALTLVFLGLIMNHTKEGTKHFIQQRISAFINLILGIIVFNFFIENISNSYEVVIEGLSNNFMWLVIMIFTFSMSFHMWIGLNHILDDYIDQTRTRRFLGLLNFAMVLIVALATAIIMINIGFF